MRSRCVWGSASVRSSRSSCSAASPTTGRPGLLSSAGLRIAYDLKISVLSRLQRQSLRFHGKHRVGDLTARVTSDVSATQDMLVQVLSTLLPNVLLVIGMFTVMLWIDPVFTSLALLAVPPLIFATHRARMRLVATSREVRHADGIVASAATEEPLEHPPGPGVHVGGRAHRAIRRAVRSQSDVGP